MLYGGARKQDFAKVCLDARTSSTTPRSPTPSSAPATTPPVRYGIKVLKVS